jgi:site-specific DNA-methyltransferase (adenine-specific)
MSNKVIFGDCYKVLSEIEANSIDLILTDPPYNISRKSNFKKNSDNKKFNNISLEFGKWDEDEIDLLSLFFEFKRVLRDGGTIVFFYDIWKCSKLKEVAQKLGLKQSRVCQWVKKNPVPINSNRNYLSNAIEFFFTFVKNKKGTFNSKYDRGIYSYPICHGKERTHHPTQKPELLIKEILEKHSNPGDLVLDPFAGSGTTGKVSKDLDRNFILIENSYEYYQLCLNRLNID